MKYNELQLAGHKSSKRAGRGISAGRGKTAGRGTKGQNSRSGGRVRPGFEGGQNPLNKRLPKLPGFTSHRPKAENVYTDQLVELSSKDIDNFVLAENKLVSSPYTKVKLLKRGEVEAVPKVTVRLQGASAKAIELIQSAGGSFTKVETLRRPVTRVHNKQS